VLHGLGRSGIGAVAAGEGIQRSYWISSRRELHKSVRLRVLWDYVVELCAREQRLLLGEPL
jgi:hypothetical protein